MKPLERVVDLPRDGKLADAARLLADAAPDVLAYTGYPRCVEEDLIEQR